MIRLIMPKYLLMGITEADAAEAAAGGAIETKEIEIQGRVSERKREVGILCIAILALVCPWTRVK